MENLRWLVGDAPNLWEVHRGQPWISCYGPLKVFESIMRGFGQVCFANNPWSGILVFVGLLVADPVVGLAALLASLTSLCMSRILEQPDEAVVAGLQNYSAVLVGSVTVSLFPLFFDIELEWHTWIGIIAMAALSVCVGLGLGILLSPFNLPIYTLPFNVTTSLLFLSIYSSGALTPELEISNSTLTEEDVDMSLVFQGVLKSSGQVYAVDSFIASALILVGLLINSPFLTMSSFIGGLLSTFIAIPINTPPYSSLYAGIWGYNGFLSAGCIAFFVEPSFTSVFLIILTSSLTPLMQGALVPVFRFNNLPIFTFPFCITSLLFLALIDAVPGAKRVKYLTYPEEHFWRARNEDK